jgi:hypothetical protein
MPHRAPAFAAKALMDRAGRTLRMPVEVRPKADHTQQQATEQAPKDPQDMAREILSILSDVPAVLPPDEVEAVLKTYPA